MAGWSNVGNIKGPAGPAGPGGGGGDSWVTIHEAADDPLHPLTQEWMEPQVVLGLTQGISVPESDAYMDVALGYADALGAGFHVWTGGPVPAMVTVLPGVYGDGDDNSAVVLAEVPGFYTYHGHFTKAGTSGITASYVSSLALNGYDINNATWMSTFGGPVAGLSKNPGEQWVVAAAVGGDGVKRTGDVMTGALRFQRNKYDPVASFGETVPGYKADEAVAFTVQGSPTETLRTHLYSEGTGWGGVKWTDTSSADKTAATISLYGNGASASTLALLIEFNGLAVSIPKDVNSPMDVRRRIKMNAAVNADEAVRLSQLPTSSREFKHNIEPLTDAASLFDAISPVTFDYKPDTDWADDYAKSVTHVGFIAEDVEAAGVAVSKVSDGTTVGLRDTELVAILWAMVKQQQAEIEGLSEKQKAEHERLSAAYTRIIELEERLAALEQSS